MNAPPFLRRSEIAGLLGEGFAIDSGPRIGRSMRTAYVALASILALFMLWSFLAPLDSAAVATGVLRADGGGRRTVQHLEGGIVRDILVREGQLVRAGQPLVLLDDTQSSAQDAALQSNYYSLLAQDARLTAERTGAAAVSYPADLTAHASDPEVAAIIAASNTAFRAKRQALWQQVSILQQRLGQASAELSSTGAQMSALGDQGALVEQEASSVQALVNEGLERQSRLLALRRQAAAVAGQRGQLTGNSARIRDVMAETRAQMTFLRGQQASEAAIQQRDVQAGLNEAREKLAISRDINKRRQVIAPVDGRVLNLRIVTRGGVVGAGQPILDLVPINEKIVILAHVKATDIDVINAGLDAEVRLTPYKARVMPLLTGKVREVGADAVYDDKSNTHYYEAVILIDPGQLKNLHDVKLVSGMPAEVFIKLGSRSLLQYLTQPMVDSFRRAFREP